MTAFLPVKALSLLFLAISWKNGSLFNKKQATIKEETDVKNLQEQDKT